MRNRKIGYMALPGLKGKFSFPTLQRSSPQFIEKVVCDFFGEDYYTIRTKSRKRNLVLCRNLTMFFTRRYTNLSWAEIAAIFDKDHTTAIHAYQSIENWSLNEAPLRDQIKFLEMKIQ